MLIQVLLQHLQGYIFQALRSKKGETIGGGSESFQNMAIFQPERHHLGNLIYIRVQSNIESVHLLISYTSGIRGHQP